jgi:hypothetical protein
MPRQQAVKTPATLSTSSTASSWSRGWFKSEARLRNMFQSACFKTDRLLVSTKQTQAQNSFELMWYRRFV